MNPQNKLELHARRLEGRRLIQAFLDGDISESSPRLSELLAEDQTLRQELNEYKQLNSMFAELPKSNDVSASVLSELRGRPVFLPREQSKRGVLRSIGFGLAASVALGAGLLLVSSSALRPTPDAKLARVSSTDVFGEAREIIRNTTGMSLEERNHRRAMLMTRVTDGIVIPEVEEIASPAVASAADSDARQVARKMAGSSKVRIERSGASVVNPGPQFASVRPASREAAVVWKAMPTAEYCGGRSRASDSPSYVVTGWYDGDSSLVPLTGVASPEKK